MFAHTYFDIILLCDQPQLIEEGMSRRVISGNECIHFISLNFNPVVIWSVNLANDSQSLFFSRLLSSLPEILKEESNHNVFDFTQ
jgi:hypothetical protein